MIFRIIDKTTKLFIRDDVSFNEETEMAIDSKPPKFGYNSKWNGTDWEDTRTQEEIDALALEREKQAKIQEAKTYLSSTDWIYAKCVEENLNASEKYPSIVAKRKEMRALINEIND